MVERIKNKVELPVWLLTLILSGIVGLFTYSISFAGNYAEMKRDIITNTQAIKDIKNTEIKSLQDTKADKNIVDLVFSKLDKIENLLLDHMQDKK